VGLEFKPLPAAIAAHWKALDASGLNSYLVANLDQIVDGMPAMYAMQTLLNEHAIYTQVTRSNPRVLRIQPPLTVSADEIAVFLGAMRQICDESEFVQRLFDGVVAKTTLGRTRAASAPPSRPLVEWPKWPCPSASFQSLAPREQAGQAPCWPTVSFFDRAKYHSYLSQNRAKTRRFAPFDRIPPIASPGDHRE